MNACTALVIEDNENNMELITFILETHGYRTLRAVTGQQGIDIGLLRQRWAGGMGVEIAVRAF